MPKNKDLKRLIRARMEKTGESYTTARLRLLEKDLPSPRDYAELAGMRDEAVRSATGRTWVEWAKYLDGLDASKLEHREIVRLVSEAGASDWWSQMVTVAYERFRGLREPGQRRGGGFDVNKSRTIGVPHARLWAAWEAGTREAWLDLALTDVKISHPRSMNLRTGTDEKVSLWFVEKGPGKSSVTVQMGGFPDRETADEVRAAWHTRLDRLAAFLSE